jgi:hypothetical protein
MHMAVYPGPFFLSTKIYHLQLIVFDDVYTNFPCKEQQIK